MIRSLLFLKAVSRLSEKSHPILNCLIHIRFILALRWREMLTLSEGGTHRLKKISTHLLTALIISVILHIEQMKRK